MAGERVYYGNRWTTIDPPDVILRRLWFTRHRLRAALYGTLEHNLPGPCWGGFHKSFHTYHYREVYWAFLVKRFVSHRDFRYWDLLQIAAQFRKENPKTPKDLDEDLVLLQAFEKHLEIKRAMGRKWWHPSEDEAIKMTLERLHREALLAGLCPHCSAELPCSDCGVPAVESHKGRLRAVVPAEPARAAVRPVVAISLMDLI